jgi:hypothetical protein
MQFIAERPQFQDQTTLQSAGRIYKAATLAEQTLSLLCNNMPRFDPTLNSILANRGKAVRRPMAAGNATPAADGRRQCMSEAVKPDISSPWCCRA